MDDRLFGEEKAMEKKDIAIIEGVRGLYEGIDSINDIGSTASIAKSLNAPVILIINSRSLVKSAAALVLGFKALDPEINIAGVILNKVKNNAHYLKTKKSIEEITGVEVIGGIIRDDSISIEQRAKFSTVIVIGKIRIINKNIIHSNYSMRTTNTS